MKASNNLIRIRQVIEECNLKLIVEDQPAAEAISVKVFEAHAILALCLERAPNEPWPLQIERAEKLLGEVLNIIRDQSGPDGDEVLEAESGAAAEGPTL